MRSLESVPPRLRAALPGFWRALAPSVLDGRARLELELEIAGSLSSLWAAGEAEHGDFGLAPDDFFAYVGERMRGDVDLLDQLERLDGAELYLVLACADGNDRALRRFEAAYFNEVRVGASRLRCSEVDLDEIEQGVRQALFGAGADGRIALVHKTARGDLRALIRLIALRIGISQGRRRSPAGSDSLMDLVDADDSPSLVAVKNEHRAKFRAALHAAVASLEPTQRTLLRLHEVDGLTLAALAKIHRVDRSTITRRLARTRAEILARTRRELAARFGVEHRDFDSFIDVIRSNFSASIHRVLAES